MDPEKIKARTDLKLKLEKPAYKVDNKSHTKTAKASVAKFLHQKEKEHRNRSLLPTIKEDNELYP